MCANWHGFPGIYADIWFVLKFWPYFFTQHIFSSNSLHLLSPRSTTLFKKLMNGGYIEEGIKGTTAAWASLRCGLPALQAPRSWHMWGRRQKKSWRRFSWDISPAAHGAGELFPDWNRFRYLSPATQGVIYWPGDFSCMNSSAYCISHSWWSPCSPLKSSALLLSFLSSLTHWALLDTAPYRMGNTSLGGLNS